ncbi:MAG: hypothetical protein DRJ96_09080 [Thermoprotei archaeon]|nr:MAG: hypothetical protein DRJ96_09080 [Thermoprotei archaeon]
MASPYLEKKVNESRQEKQKYFAKVLSENAIWNNYLRAIDTEGVFGEWAWAESMYFIWLDISNLFIFGLEPYETAPLDPEFRAELPTLEEFLQGIKLKLIPLDVGEAYRQFYWDYYQGRVPPLLDYATFVLATCWPEYFGWLIEQKRRKLIVGESTYGTSYVDPPVIRDFIRATLLELAKRRMDFNRIRKLYQVAVDRGFIVEGVVEAIYNRLALHFQALFETFILDYNLLNYSKLCKRGSQKATFPIITWRGEEYDVEFTRFDELNAGFILNITPLNLGILMDRKSMFKPNPRAPAKVGTPVPAHFIDWKVRRMISRYRATGVAFGNYQRPEETLAYYRSERADHYHQLRLFFYHLDALVDAILEHEDVDVFRKNLYKRAVAMLIGHKKKRHRWGYDAFKSMSEEEFKAWWLEYWRRQGLDVNTLNKLYERVSKWLPRLRSDLENLGERVRRRREQLALLLR